MNTKFDFTNLFVLDLANNHQGSVEHGLAAIKQHAQVANTHGIRAALKFQFRQLDSFIHPDFKDATDVKHVSRFMSTKLGREEYQVLFDAAKSAGLMTICTPFDEESVDIIKDMGFDLIKVASYSAQDWPLLEKVATSNLPIVFSTGSLLIEDIDRFVSFAEHRGLDFAIMHCVSIYPTPSELCNLQNIAMLKQRYPNVEIGWSTHEDPDDCNAVKVAYALGGRMFERHVGVATETVKLNAYSSTPAQASKWYDAWKEAVKLCGSFERLPPEPQESKAILELQRGVFLKHPMKADQEITEDDVFFAMPCQPGQLTSGHFINGILLKKTIEANGPVMDDQISLPRDKQSQKLAHYIHKVKAMLNMARIDLGVQFDVEYSHHYGIERFGEVGCVLIDCINREYCKKLLVQLPKQSHPHHFHKLKEETFQVLHGEMFLEIDGRVRQMYPGDIQTVMPGTWHRFWTETGCIVEEVSTTHFQNDSVYKDPAINEMSKQQRKTVVKHWGRFHISRQLGEDGQAAEQQDELSS